MLIEMVRAIRNVRAEYQVEPGRQIQAIIDAGGRHALLAEQAALLIDQARLDPEKFVLAEQLDEKPAQALTLVIGGVELYIPLAGMIDLDAERKRLHGEIARIEGEIQRVDKLLANPGFMNKAPAEVIEREREKRVTHEENLEKLRQRLDTLA